jgi:serine/threonine protein kinase
VLGHGSYATVLELQYKGLKCAGKKIHEVLLRQGASSYSVRRFEEECDLLSKVRHPNIVQFLGFCYEPGVELPILIMEFLPTTLAASIENYGVMPTDINYSILHDVAVGLYYLHSRPQPIIHRDLSSNNVLLTRDMKAKISDLGVARILDVSPLKASRMTQTPGTAAFMPPEVMTAKPTYDTSIDEFSFGILMIHVLSGQWPAPQTGSTRTNEDGTFSVITEADRRQNFLAQIGTDHPLMELLLRCIHNNPTQRAHAEELVQRLAEVASLIPSSHTTRLEMQRKVELCERKAKELDLACSTRKEQLQVQSEELTNTRETTTSLTRLLQQKDDTVAELSGQLNRVTSFLATNKQVSSMYLYQYTIYIQYHF